MVQRHQRGWPKAHIAAAMGVSRKCVRTWIDRYTAEGERGLQDRSSRPHRSPRRTAPEVEERIVELRQQARRGPDWLAAELGVAPRTVSRVLARRGAPRLAALDPLTGQVLRASKGHRGALRTRPPRRTGAHGRQETRAHPRWRRLAGAGPSRP